jgi:hypothetical protein
MDKPIKFMSFSRFIINKMKSLAALKDLTSKLKQQAKQAVPPSSSTPWVK